MYFRVVEKIALIIKWQVNYLVEIAVIQIMVYSKVLVQVKEAERVYSGVRGGGGRDVGQGRHGCHGDGTTDTDSTRSLSTSLLHPYHSTQQPPITSPSKLLLALSSILHTL